MGIQPMMLRPSKGRMQEAGDGACCCVVCIANRNTGFRKHSLHDNNASLVSGFRPTSVLDSVVGEASSSNIMLYIDGVVCL